MATAAATCIPNLRRDGAQLFPQALGVDDQEALDCAFSTLPPDRPGARLGSGLAHLLATPDAIARRLLGPAARPVRAILFDKGAGSNWSLGWHQDRVIAVRRRLDAPGFAGWTVKAGIDHVVPPFEILERMLTLRLHLDSAGSENAPLRILLGSHKLSRIAEKDIKDVAARLGHFTCAARRGDVWAYAAPIVHASDRSAAPGRRRVLQLSYSADDLPGGLQWLGV
jgi:hypothetical protein